MIPLLVVDDIVPSPELGYGYPRAFENLRLMREVGFEPTLVPIRDPTGYICNDELVTRSGVRIVRPVASGWRAIGEVVDLARSHGACWISRISNYRLVASAIREACPDVVLIYDVEALTALRRVAEAEISGRSDGGSLEEEVDVIRTADICVSVCEYEAALLRARGVDVTAVIGHVHSNRVSPTPFRQRWGLLHVGGFFHDSCPNRDAIAYLLSEILPIVARAVPGIHLDVVGYRSDGVDDLRRGSKVSRHVRIHGTQSDLTSWYDQTRVVVVPTRIAAGIAFKATEAIACGVPVVCTPVIARQVGAPPTALRVCDAGEVFAQEIVTLHTNESEWMGARAGALMFARGRFSRKLILQEMLRVYRAVEATIRSVT